MRFARAFFGLFLLSTAGAVFACSAPSDDAASSDEDNLTNENDVFGKSDVMSVTLSAPFSKLFARFKNNQADPPKAPKEGGVQGGFQEPDYSEPGVLVFTQDGAEKKIDLHVFIRGESSKGDCPFPKLKIDFDDKEQLKKTPFKGHGKMRLNTHCGPGDISARSGMGRVTNGVGPVREELTYRLIREAGIPTYLTRVVKIHYDDTADKSQTDTFGVLIESGDDAAQRFAKMDPPLIPKEAVYLAPNQANAGQITPSNSAELIVAEAFSGNKDWVGTHNIDTFGVLNAPTKFQIAQDFDLGAIVMGDIAKYWKGVAPVTDAQQGLRDAPTAKVVLAHKAAMEKAYAEAEKSAILANAIASQDGRTTTDPGFLEAKKRIADLYALPELGGAPVAPADAGAPADAAVE